MVLRLTPTSTGARPSEARLSISRSRCCCSCSNTTDEYSAGGSRGLSLDNFVGLVAEREAATILRSGRRSAWAETPTADDVLALGPDDLEPERRLASRTWLASFRCRAPLCTHFEAA
jgi:hypothetical protein